MKICYSSKFARKYKKLPLKIKRLAESKKKIFRKNPFDKKLNIHKLSGSLKNFWAFSINQKHCIVFEFADKNIIWFHLVGDHSIYK
jgi:addiction module RelE/StbE family toxin